MIVVGIDPGTSGAIAVVSCEMLVNVFDMPVEEKSGRGAISKQVDAWNLAETLRTIRSGMRDDVMVVSEAQHAMIGSNVNGRRAAGAALSFSIADSAGVVRGVVGALGMRHELVYPQSWKRRYGIGADKDAALRRARDLFPDMAGYFARKKDHNRADAALIALYGWSKYA